MESNESIRANITELRDEKRTAKRVKKLPRNLRGVGDLITQIIRRPDKARSWTFEAEKAEDRDALIAEFFDGLSDDDRALVWNALFPKLSTHLERAWRDRAGMVYQHSYSRRPFHAIVTCAGVGWGSPSLGTTRTGRPPSMMTASAASSV